MCCRTEPLPPALPLPAAPRSKHWRQASRPQWHGNERTWKRGLSRHEDGLIRTKVIETRGARPRYSLIDSSYDRQLCSSDSLAELLTLCETPPSDAKGYRVPSSRAASIPSSLFLKGV